MFTDDCVSMSSKCTYVLNRSSKCPDSSELSLLKHRQISKCTYVLNGCSKSSGETVQMPRWSELSLLAHAIKTNADCMSTSTK